MLFKFKSQAASDLIMLEADARRLLKIILGDDPVKGIVLAQDLPAAIAALEAAVAQDEAQRKERATKAEPDDDAENDEPAARNTVRLAQRAAPMLKLLKMSLAQEADVVWGV
jgi:Domain of unknown function (DUF1840)